MTLVAPFTEQELAAAFRLIVSKEEADALASAFFEFRRRDEEGRGYVMLPDASSRPIGEGSLVTVVPRGEAKPEIDPAWAVQLQALQPKGRADILLACGTITLDLLTLVSDDVARRIQAARSLTDDQLKRIQDETRRALALTTEK